MKEGNGREEGPPTRMVREGAGIPRWGEEDGLRLLQKEGVLKTRVGSCREKERSWGRRGWRWERKSYW